MITGHLFKLEIPKREELSQQIEKIKMTVLELPWSSIKKEPLIIPVGENEKSYILELTIYAIDKKFFFEIENYLRENYSYITERSWRAVL